ncbi:hypothetical protein [Methanococcus voltae]|uniref:Uncharacterized protein n=1 Tax=Methanococcus voltae (strain ATCC BAA-1334 / A3) TaxID=456320 RepID=D7DRF6_METV3|nr:hypothetical protein [Methanococcus voltae]MCS3901093.1 hypothetical protein [Methanococcus voltae]
MASRDSNIPIIFVGIIIIILTAVPLILTTEKVKSETYDYKVKQVGVVSYETYEDEDGNTYLTCNQVVSELGNRLHNELDRDSKLNICKIVWISVNEFETLEKCTILSKYNNSGTLVDYYKFEIEQQNFKVLNLRNVSRSEYYGNLEYYYPKIMSLGELEVYYR